MSLGIAIAKSPFGKPTDDENFDIGQDISLDEWDELFLNVLEVPEITPNNGESRKDFLDRREKLFQEILTSKGYEMLGRICHFSQDAFFAVAEVKKLLEECLNLQQKTQNECALLSSP
jgi:hypothetical protein